MRSTFQGIMRRLTTTKIVSKGSTSGSLAQVADRSWDRIVSKGMLGSLAQVAEKLGCSSAPKVKGLSHQLQTKQVVVVSARRRMIGEDRNMRVPYTSNKGQLSVLRIPTSIVESAKWKVLDSKHEEEEHLHRLSYAAVVASTCFGRRLTQG